MFYQPSGRKVKYLALLICLFSINLCNGQDTIDSRNTMSLIRLKYLNTDTFYISKMCMLIDSTPITGIVVDSFILGNLKQLSSATLYINGIALMNNIYYPNSILKIREYYSYKEGFKQGDPSNNRMYNGPFLEYYQDGNKKIEGWYTQEQKDRTWNYYDENGILKYSEEWVNGKLVKSKNYNKY